MAKNLYDAMTSEVEAILAGIKFDLLSIEEGVKKKDDGKHELFTRVEVEIPKGNGVFSRCRFKCKLPLLQMNVSEEELERGISVTLTGVKVTYVSAQKEIFTRADGLQLV